MRELVVTDRAKQDIESIADFLATQFSNRAKIDFLLRLSEHFTLIEKMPLMYPASLTHPSVRRCVVHKNVALFYQLTDELILVLAVVDTRTNPDEIQF